METAIHYKDAKWAWKNYRKYIENLIIEKKLHRICDVGGGARPLLNVDFITKNNLDYVVFDISDKELAKSASKYQTRNFNFCRQALDKEESSFDLVFSIMTMEHVKNIAQFHENIYTSVKPGGYSFHFFPCLNSLPMLANYIAPHGGITERLVYSLQPWRSRKAESKFPAYYGWCYGPTQKNRNRFEAIGYDIVEYIGFFGHTYYDRMPGLRELEAWKTRILCKYPNPHLTINSYLLLQRPS